MAASDALMACKFYVTDGAPAPPSHRRRSPSRSSRAPTCRTGTRRSRRRPWPRPPRRGAPARLAVRRRAAWSCPSALPDQRLQRGAHLRAHVAGAHGEAEDLAQHLLDLIAGEVVHGGDDHGPKRVTPPDEEDESG